MNRRSFRSPLARAVGLGSAKKGSQHWWAERVTAVALVPLTLWFVASIIAHAGSDYATFITWRASAMRMIACLLTAGCPLNEALRRAFGSAGVGSTPCGAFQSALRRFSA